MIPKTRLFAWKLVRKEILTRGNLGKIGIDINGDCPLYQNHLEDIDHLFMKYGFVQEAWNIMVEYCPIYINNDLSFIE